MFILCVSSVLWCHKCFVVSQVFCGVTSVLWCHKCFVVSQVFCGVTSVLWCHKCFVVSQVFCGVTSVLWCHKCFVMSQVFCGVTETGFGGEESSTSERAKREEICRGTGEQPALSPTTSPWQHKFFTIHSIQDIKPCYQLERFFLKTFQ